MNKKNYTKYKRELSKLNEVRKKFWKELRSLRNNLLKNHDPKDDAECIELFRFINDMWESGLKEELKTN